MLYIVIIASYGRATAAPVARIILLCTLCHCMGFVVLHSVDLSGSFSIQSLKRGLDSSPVFFSFSEEQSFMINQIL